MFGRERPTYFQLRVLQIYTPKYNIRSYTGFNFKLQFWCMIIIMIIQKYLTNEHIFWF